MRIFLLLLMGLLVLMMASCPGLHDSKRMAVASHHHIKAPSEITYMQIEKAREDDYKSIVAKRYSSRHYSEFACTLLSVREKSKLE